MTAIEGYHVCARGYGCPPRTVEHASVAQPVNLRHLALVYLIREQALIDMANDEWLEDVAALLFQSYLAQQLGFNELQAACLIGFPYGSQGELAALFGVSQPTVSRAQLRVRTALAEIGVDFSFDYTPKEGRREAHRSRLVA